MGWSGAARARSSMAKIPKGETDVGTTWVVAIGRFEREGCRLADHRTAVALGRSPGISGAYAPRAQVL
jgi:hypothetical protein